jgi:hypothetical protein
MAGLAEKHAGCLTRVQVASSPLDSNILAGSKHAAQHRSFHLKNTVFELCWQLHSIVQQRLQRRHVPAQMDPPASSAPLHSDERKQHSAEHARDGTHLHK